MPTPTQFPSLGPINGGPISAMDGTIHPSKDVAVKMLKSTCVDQGFSVVTLNSSRGNHYFICDRGGVYDPTKEGVKGKIKGCGSRKCDCKFKAKLYTDVPTGQTTISILNNTHNHPQAEAKKHATVRREARRQPETLAAILSKASQQRNSGADIAESIRQDFHIEIDKIDVRNELRRHRQQLWGGATPFQQFLNILNGEAYKKFVRRENDESTGRINAILWTDQANISLWKKNPDVVSYDATYCTNRYNMPLVQVTGTTCTHSTFMIAYALVSSEDEEGHKWVNTQLLRLMDQFMIRRPYVFLSDRDQALKNAVSELFGDTVKQQICRWHVFKNVCFHAVKKWDVPLEGTLVGSMTGRAGLNIKGDEWSEEKNTEELEDKSGKLASRHLRGEDREVFLRGSKRHATNKALPQAGSRATNQPNPDDNTDGEEEADWLLSNNNAGASTAIRSSNDRRRWGNTADGVVAAFTDVAYALTERECDIAWQQLQEEFHGQAGTS